MRTCSLCLVPMLRGYSAETIEKYVQDVRALAASLGGEGHGTPHLWKYIDLSSPQKSCMGQNLGHPVSRNRDLVKNCEVQRRACCKIEF